MSLHNSPTYLTFHKRTPPTSSSTKSPAHPIVNTTAPPTPLTAAYLLLFPGRIHNVSEAVKLVGKVHLARECCVTVSKLHLNVWVMLGLGTSLMDVKVLPVS